MNNSSRPVYQAVKENAGKMNMSIEDALAYYAHAIGEDYAATLRLLLDAEEKACSDLAPDCCTTPK